MYKSFLMSIPAALLLAGCASEAPARDVPMDCARETAVPAGGAAYAAAASRSSRAGASLNKQKRTSNFASVEGRQVAFSATLRISSPDVSAALKQANEIARNAGGYASEVNDRAATLKIPVKNAETALAELEKIGTITSRSIRAEDVTDTMFDLDMRIANLEKLHKKLTDLVEKAGGVKDILAVEQELSRVTGELERLKASRLNLQKRVDFVTFRLYFSASAAQEVKVRKFLMPQVSSLGLWSNRLAVSNADAKEAPFRFSLPQGFIPVSMTDYSDFFAVDGEDTVLSAVSLRQLPEADLKFWENAIARSLRELRGYELKTEIRTDADGNSYILFRGERMRGKQPMRYEASCRIVTRLFGSDEVHIVEILGTKERMDKIDLEAMHKSVK